MALHEDKIDRTLSPTSSEDKSGSLRIIFLPLRNLLAKLLERFSKVPSRSNQIQETLRSFTNFNQE